MSAAPVTTPVVQVLPFEVRIVRWWQSTGLWMQVWSLAELWLPILLLTDFQVLGFTAKEAGMIGLVLKLANVTMTMTQKNKSVTVIGSKDDVAVVDVAPDATPVTVTPTGAVITEGATP